MKNKIGYVISLGLISLIFLTACPPRRVTPTPTEAPTTETPTTPTPEVEPTVEPTKPDELDEPDEPDVSGREFVEVPQLKPVYFEFDKYEILPEARAILTENAKYLKDNPKLMILIEGHCCECGTHDYNMGLGARRAHAVRDFYKALGIDTKRMATISCGEEQPVAKGVCLVGHTEAGAKNMRAVTKVREP